MREVWFQQVLRDEAAMQATRELLLRLGQKRLGPADDATAAALDAVDDLDWLERMLDRVGKVVSWQEVLDTPRKGTLFLLHFTDNAALTDSPGYRYIFSEGRAEGRVEEAKRLLR